MMNRVAYAAKINFIPEDTLKRSRKYQTAAGMPPRALPTEVPDGRRPEEVRTCTNSVVMKNSAKNTKNFAITDRRTNDKLAFNAERRMPNMVRPSTQ
jgi:hypothetical protein